MQPGSFHENTIRLGTLLPVRLHEAGAYATILGKNLFLALGACFFHRGTHARDLHSWKSL